MIIISDNIGLYPYITSNIKSQIREFTIKLYAIYMNTLHACQKENILLSLYLT